MTFLLGIAQWLPDPTHWQGADGIPTRVGEHALLSGVALLFAAFIALPLGIGIGHSGRGALLAINVAGIGRAIPSLAILALVLPVVFRLGLGLGFWPTVLTLIPLGIPLILLSSFTAIRAVDRDLIEAARGMGMSEWQVLSAVELPLAATMIVDGIGTAAVTIVATATLGALVASGGLGRYLVDGLARQDQPRLVVGALLVALLAIATQIGFGVLARLAAPRTSRSTATSPDPAP
jgi:osmoprotectant transport system permease protein